MTHFVDALLYKTEGRGFDFLTNPYGRIVALGSNLPLIEMSSTFIFLELGVGGVE